MPGVDIPRSGLLFVDSFDHLADGQFTMKWTSVANSVRTTGRSGYGLHVGTFASGPPSITLGGTYATLFAGYACNTASFAPLGVGPIVFTGTAPAVADIGVSIQRQGDGRVYVNTSGWGTKNSANSIFSFNLYVWYFIEFTAHLYPSASPGGASITYTIRVNNVVILAGTFTGLTSTGGKAQAFTAVTYGYPSGNKNIIDDVYVTDATVGFLGDTIWGVIRPDGEGLYQDFTPDSGAVHYDRINELTPDTTTYLASSTPGHEESEDYEDIVATGDIVGVHMNLILKKTTSGECTAKMLLIDGVNPDWEDPDVFMPSETSYYDYTYGFATNPLTSSAWTESAVNGLQLGVKRHT